MRKGIDTQLFRDCTRMMSGLVNRGWLNWILQQHKDSPVGAIPVCRMFGLFAACQQMCWCYWEIDGSNLTFCGGGPGLEDGRLVCLWSCFCSKNWSEESRLKLFWDTHTHTKSPFFTWAIIPAFYLLPWFLLIPHNKYYGGPEGSQQDTLTYHTTH